MATPTIMDDFSIPEETRIYYTTKKYVIQNIILLVAMIIGLYFLIIPSDDDERVLGIILSAVAVVFLYINGKIIANRKPQIIINNKGIETSTCDFKSWNEIYSEKITPGYRTGDFLTYNFIGDDTRFHIGNLDIKNEQLEDLLRVYRNRYDTNKRDLAKNHSR